MCVDVQASSGLAESDGEASFPTDEAIIVSGQRCLNPEGQRITHDIQPRSANINEAESPAHHIATEVLQILTVVSSSLLIA